MANAELWSKLKLQFHLNLLHSGKKSNKSQLKSELEEQVTCQLDRNIVI